MPSSPADAQTWDVSAIGSALGHPPEATSDVAFGEGTVYRLGAAQAVDLELFPDAGVVRVIGGDLQLSLFRQATGPRLAPEGLVFELPHMPDGRFLSVSPAGEVTLLLIPPSESTGKDAKPAFLWPQDAPDRASRPNTHLEDQGLLAGDPVPPDGASREPSPTAPGEATADKEQDYIPRLTGRLARNPRFHTNRKGVLVGEFDLGVKDSDDPTKTTWHAIAVFGARAEQLKEGFQKGDLVDVIGGYRHVREFAGRDGRPRRKEQIYPTVVKRR